MTDLLQQQAIARHVNAAMQTLPRSQRAAIALCHYQGLRNVEAAEVLGVSVEALESILARGRRRLRARLREMVPHLLGDA
jgi:RNA polymerase sigma-70 factor (ECF subfamily)